MLSTRASHRLAFIVAFAPVLLATCAKKGEPKPVVQEAAPTADPSTPTPAPSPTPKPTPPPVWRTAPWGTTRSELLAAFPREAQKLDRSADFAKPQPGSTLTGGIE